MDEAIRFFRINEFWIYTIAVIGAFIYIRRLVLARDERGATIFGLERARASARMRQSTTVLILLTLIAVSEFVLVSYIAPLRPDAVPLLTPTIDLLATPTATLPPDTIAMPDVVASGAGPTPTVDVRIGACVPGVREITSPAPGEQVRGEISIEGSASNQNFGFYKLEISLQSEQVWRTIQAGRDQVFDDVLVEQWDTSTLDPGNYFLRLVVADNNDQALEECQVPISILFPEE